MGSAFQKMLLATLAVGFTLPFHTVGQEIATKSGGGAAVFVMTNSVEKNEVIVFNRVTDGSLQEAGHYSTGGRGSGGNTDPLESQGSLTLNADHSLLLAVNAGSGELSLFRVLGPRLVLADTVASGGSEPNAVAVIGNLVYVLNTGGSSNVVGFTIDHNKLRQIPDSTRFLTTNTSGAASVAFSPDGKFLVVTERLTNNLDVFAVQPDGSLAARVVTPSAGPGAFSVAFASNGTAIVSETGPANVANGSAVSSYHLLRNGTLSPISATKFPKLLGDSSRPY
jgi:6-phosphogluconolactonase